MKSNGIPGEGSLFYVEFPITKSNSQSGGIVSSGMKNSMTSSFSPRMKYGSKHSVQVQPILETKESSPLIPSKLEPTIDTKNELPSQESNELKSNPTSSNSTIQLFDIAVVVDDSGLARKMLIKTIKESFNQILQVNFTR